MSKTLLLVSVSLNIALLLFFALVCARSGATKAISAKLEDTIQNGQKLRPHSKHAARVATPWSQLESSDLAIYAANLRAAGCPPKTVRDILLPLIEEKFAQPDAFIFEPTNFWASFSQRQAAAIARTERETTLRQEKEKLLQEMLGFAWTSESLNQAYAGETAGALGFLDYERAEKLLCIADRFRNELSPADHSRRFNLRSALYETWRQEAGEILSSQEFEEAELRGLLTIFQRHNPNLRNAGLNGSELRQLMIYRRDLCKPLPSALLTGSDELLKEPDSAGEQQFLSKVRSLLGESRFIDYLKDCDVRFEKTLAALEKEHLARSLALEMFDFREEAIARAEEIRQLPMPRGEKRTQLAALRQNALEQLASLKNAATDGPLFNIVRDWLPDDTKQKPSADNAFVELNRDWLQEIANP